VPVTSTLLVANLAIYVWMMRASGMKSGFDYATLTYFGANIVGTGQDPSHWRWVTAEFVHRHPIHIAMTLWVLAQIGVTVERALGSGVVGAGYVLTGALGNALSAAVNASRHNYLQSSGASAALMGLIGIAATFAWRTGERRITRTVAINVAIVLVLGYFLDLDNIAHAGAFVAGGLIGLACARWPRRLPRGLDAALVGASAAVAVAAFVVVRAYHGYH
jgi:membrane associated rhomboid family serine protease